MALSGLDRRASKLEDALVSLKEQKAAEERKAWREANSERLRWEMFLRNHGPESLDLTEETIADYDDDDKEDARAAIAAREVLQKLLAKYDGDMPNRAAMDAMEKGISYILEEWFWAIDHFELLSEDLERWSDVLGLDETDPPFIELINAIDEHTGSSHWREIYYLQEAQDDAIEQLFENYEDRRGRRLKYKAEHAEDVTHEDNDDTEEAAPRG